MPVGAREGGVIVGRACRQPQPLRLHRRAVSVLGPSGWPACAVVGRRVTQHVLEQQPHHLLVVLRVPRLQRDAQRPRRAASPAALARGAIGVGRRRRADGHGVCAVRDQPLQRLERHGGAHRVRDRGHLLVVARAHER